MPISPAEGFNPVAPPGSCLAAALEGSGVQLMEAMLRRAGQQSGGAALQLLDRLATGVLQLLGRTVLSLLAHSPEQQAAALAATEATQRELAGGPGAPIAALQILSSCLTELRSVQLQEGDPSPALLLLAGLLAGVLCDMGPALQANVDLQSRGVQSAVLSCLSLTALLASHGTDAVRRAWRAQLLSLEPFRLVSACMEAPGNVGLVSFKAEAVCAVVAAVHEELRATALHQRMYCCGGQGRSRSGSVIRVMSSVMFSHLWLAGPLSTLADTLELWQKGKEAADLQTARLQAAAQRFWDTPQPAVSYCSSECQLAHWQVGHSRACAGTAACGQAGPSRRS